MAFGTQELVIVLVAFFFLFGAERLPKIARSLGMSKKEFQEGFAVGPEKPGDTTEEDLDRGGRTEAAALTEQAEEWVLKSMEKHRKKLKMKCQINQLEN